MKCQRCSKEIESRDYECSFVKVCYFCLDDNERLDLTDIRRNISQETERRKHEQQ